MATVAARVRAEVAAAMSALVADTSDDKDIDGDTVGEDGQTPFAQIRDDPGNVSLATVREEIAKLTAIQAVGLPAGRSPGSRRRW